MGNKSGYEVADFHLSGNKAEAWFDNKGNWVMTKTEINFGLLPEPVRLNLNGGEYKNWKPTDFDKLERSNAATVYVIEVEQGEQEVDLYYTEDGVLLKAVPDDDNDNNFQPVVIPQAISDAINEMYPGATMLEFDQEKMVLKWISSIIISTRMFISTLKTKWISTEWDITKDQVPAIVMNALQASEYKNYTIDDIDLIEKPEGTFYVFDLEQGDNDVKVTFDSEGNIKSTQKD